MKQGIAGEFWGRFERCTNAARTGELTALVLAERKEEARRVLEELRGESVDPARMAKLKASIERLPWGRPGLVSRGGATPARSPRCPWR